MHHFQTDQLLLFIHSTERTFEYSPQHIDSWPSMIPQWNSIQLFLVVVCVFLTTLGSVESYKNWMLTLAGLKTWRGYRRGTRGGRALEFRPIHIYGDDEGWYVFGPPLLFFFAQHPGDSDISDIIYDEFRTWIVSLLLLLTPGPKGSSHSKPTQITTFFPTPSWPCVVKKKESGGGRTFTMYSEPRTAPGRYDDELM